MYCSSIDTEHQCGEGEGRGGEGERERGYFTLLYFTSRVGTSRAVAGDYMDPIHTCRVLTMVPNVRGTLYT